jgi:pimeloyl-ACP methyl ester carboxylesterase
MPYVTYRDVRIHYQVEGKGSALVFRHGIWGSIDDWYEYGYVDLLIRGDQVFPHVMRFLMTRLRDASLASVSGYVSLGVHHRDLSHIGLRVTCQQSL